LHSGDRITKWHALEGLGAIFYNKGDKPRAFEYFTKALQNVEENNPACERIRKKLWQLYHLDRGIPDQRHTLDEQITALVCTKSLSIRETLFKKKSHQKRYTAVRF
jgi:hypothetical protein